VTTGAEEQGRAAWAGRSIAFRVVRSDRASLSITVEPSGAVTVRAPREADFDQIVERVSRRGGWISYHQAQSERWQPRMPPRTFEAGETHLYLGRQYRLTVEQGLRQQVRVSGDRLILSMHRPSNVDGRRILLADWYLAQARSAYASRLNVLFRPFAAKDHKHPRLIIRKLTHRWGSLTPAGNMLLSRELIRAPRSCIDYVIVHELCHLDHANHGEGFWLLLSRLMPDFERRKARLERVLL